MLELVVYYYCYLSLKAALNILLSKGCYLRAIQLLQLMIDETIDGELAVDCCEIVPGKHQVFRNIG